jgi:hypothetical protein
MTTDSNNTIANLGRKWKRNPEPSFPSKNPQVVLDCNIDGQAWLYDSMDETESYLVYEGDTAPIEQ